MPTYDYVCENCEHAFEEFQSISAKSLRKCPECGKQKLKRLIGIGAGVIFKGSGFYETDYRSEGYKKAEKAEKADKDGGEKKADTPSGSKTESKDKKPSETKAASDENKNTKPKNESKKNPSSDNK